MLNKFQDYLISKGYSELTPKGKPSTAHDYSKSRIPKICEREKKSREPRLDEKRYPNTRSCST